jgi:hypothetical protein
MDADHATVHVVNAAWLKIVNFYTTCGTGGIRDAVVVENGQVMINSWHSHSGSPHQTLTVNGGDVTVMGASLTRFETTTYAVLTQGNGTLRMIGVKMFAQLPQAYALPLIIQAGGSNLQLDNIDVSGAVGSSGTAVFINTDNVGNSIGRVTLGTGWVNQIQPTFNVGSYGVVASSGGAMTQPLSIAMAPSATTAQLRIAGGGNVNAAESKLWFHGTFPTGGDFFPYLAASIRAGWNVTSWTGGYLNIWLTNATNNPSSDVNMAPIASFTPFGVSLSGDTTFTGTVKGFSMFPVVGSSNSDITHGINLYAGATYGFGVTAARLNYNVGVNSIHAFMVNGADVGLFSASGVTSNFQMQVGGTGGPTWTTGSAAPVANSPVGSLYSRVGGAVGATLYVSRGGGTWAAVAGV